MITNHRAIESRLKQEVDDYCAEFYDDGFRSHLGASTIGEDCANKLWLQFRWCDREKVNGRVQRLFQRGHREEQYFVQYLRGIGFTVWEFDPSIPETEPKHKRQWKISRFGGHYGGSTDGVCEFPPHWEIPGRYLLEFKTNATGAGYNAVGGSGIEVAKPVHWSQCNAYGHDLRFEDKKLDGVVYGILNKNDDDITWQVRNFDEKLGEILVKKAERIIASDRMMPKLSENPTNRDCTYCKMKDVCHKGKKPMVNCRSCKMAEPKMDGTWFCHKWSATIPGKNEMLQACPEWSPIVNG